MAKKLNIPHKIKLGYFVYSLRLEQHVIGNGDELCYGLTDFERMEIQIDAKQSTQMQRETLFHELLHVALHDCGLVESDLEEKLIRVISPRVMQFMQDNPELVKVLFHGKK